MTPAPTDLSWYQGLPKAEVHVHLEGCIPTDVLALAADQAGVDVPTWSIDTDGLSGFLDYLDRSCRLITDAALVELLGYRFGERLSADGTRYADLIWNPTHWPVWSDRIEEFVEALHKGASAAEADGHPPMALCPSLKRNQSGEEALALVELLGSMQHPRVVGLSIDGNEASTGRTGERFAPAYARAAELGLRRAAHAGESSGPEGVRDAIDLLGAERIDHGVRAIEDPALVAELAERRLPLDVCPTSNLTLGLFATAADHPLERLRQAGVRVSVNTDDPEILGLTLATEYRDAAATHGWTVATVADVAQTSIDACFAPDATKAAISADLAAYAAEEVAS